MTIFMMIIMFIMMMIIIVISVIIILSKGSSHMADRTWWQGLYFVGKHGQLRHGF